MSVVQEINTLVKKAAREPLSSDADARRIDSEAMSSGRPALRAPTKDEWFRRVLGGRPKATISAGRPSGGASIQGGNHNPDEMLGKRMNPILIAPEFAFGQSLPTGVVAVTKKCLGDTIGSDAGTAGLRLARDAYRDGVAPTLSRTFSM